MHLLLICIEALDHQNKMFIQVVYVMHEIDGHSRGGDAYYRGSLNCQINGVPSREPPSITSICSNLLRGCLEQSCEVSSDIPKLKDKSHKIILVALTG